MLDLNKSKVRQHFSQEFLDKEIQRVQSAGAGAILFEMDEWDNPMLIDFVLESAKVDFHKENIQRTVLYIKS